MDLADYPYTVGATFDKATNTFAWTPHAEDQGDVTLKFNVVASDGTTTVAGVPQDAIPGQLVTAEVVGTEGVDLVARALVPAVVPTGR